MDIGAIMIIMLVAGVLILTFYVIGIYNKLIDARNRVEDQFAQIDVELKRRIDLIPNLVEVVKGYAKHEEKTLTEVINARNKMASAGSINEELDASHNVSKALNKLFALSESYPELKANTNFIALQEELTETEDKIGYARSFYNDTVLNYNNLRKKIPSNIIANIFKFKEINYFGIKEEEKELPKIKF